MVVVGDQEPLGDLRRLSQTLYICRKWQCFEVEAGRAVWNLVRRLTVRLGVKTAFQFASHWFRTYCR